MSPTPLEQLWEYNARANEQLFSLLEEYGERTPAICLQLISHIVNAQSNWLDRLNGVPQSIEVWALHNLPDCRRLHQVTSGGLRALMDLHRDDPEWGTGTEILLHVFTHGCYHRGQIALELRRAGLEPVNTDLIP